MPPPATSPARPAESVVETMLDRPVAQVARFVGQTLLTWLRGLVDPWRLGAAAADGARGLAPPFAFLVVTLFLAGVARRLLWAMAAVPIADDSSLVEDLRVALGEVSLTSATLVTLPCVVIVALGARVVSLLFRRRGRLDRDVVVRAACYAVGWQAGGVTVVAMLLVALQVAGYEPSGALNDEMNTVLPWVALIGLAWGATILSPTLRRLLPARAWATPVAVVLAAAVTAPTFVASFATLGVSTDLSSAAQLRTQRQLDAWVGDLHVNVLRARELDDSDRLELTVAYTSRADDVVVVPASEAFGPPKQAHRRFQSVLPVERSSIAELPDRALVIEPGETRVAVYEVRPPDAARPKNAPFAAPYYRRHPDGLYTDGEAVFWRSAIRVAEQPAATTK